MLNLQTSSLSIILRVLWLLRLWIWCLFFLLGAGCGSNSTDGRDGKQICSHFIITTIFTSNLIGVVFARTLHYQFYVWYFHTIPYLLWHAEVIPVVVKIFVFCAIEIAFNVYPATAWSSGLLQVRSHCTKHFTALHCTTLHCTTLHCTTLHCTTLHCTTLHYTTPHHTTVDYHNYCFSKVRVLIAIRSPALETC
jgi:ALG3 protein